MDTCFFTAHTAVQSKDCLDGWTDEQDEWIDGWIERYRHTDVILPIPAIYKNDPLSCWAFGGWLILSFMGLILGSHIGKAFTVAT